MTFETDDNVDTTATENTGVEVETEQTGQETEQQAEIEKTITEQSDEEKAQQEAEQEKKKSRATKRVQDALARAAQAEQKLAEYESKQNAPKPQDAPKVEDFEDYSDYQKAQQDWYIEQAEQRVIAKIQQQQEQQSSVQQKAEFESAMGELEDEGVDVSALAKKADTLPPLPIQLDQFGLGVKETLKLAADLIQNDELYFELSQMNPVQAARRIGQEIDKQQGKPIAPKIPNAPRPITPVKANAPAKRDFFAQSDDEIMKGL